MIASSKDKSNKISKTPKPPADLSAAAKKLWTELYESSDMDPAAVVLLDSLVQSWARVQQARELLSKDGITITETTAAGNTHVKPHPALAIEATAAAHMARCWHLLGYDQQPPAGA